MGPSRGGASDCPLLATSKRNPGETSRTVDFGASLGVQEHMAEPDTQAARAAQEAEWSAAQGDRLLVVGIGASAGGLDAFERFLRHVPSSSGLAFVLVQH